MLKTLQNFSDKVNSIYTLLASAFLILVIISTFTQVFSRYVLNASFSWTEEFARYSFIWMNMLGSSVAVKFGTHAKIDVLDSVLNDKVKVVIQMIVNIAIFIAAMIMIIQGIKMVGVATGQPSPVMGFPMNLVYLSVPVGGFGILVHLVTSISNILFSTKKGFDTKKEVAN